MMQKYRERSVNLQNLLRTLIHTFDQKLRKVQNLIQIQSS